LNDNSQERREENNNNNNAITSSSISFLSTIMQPIFHDSNSSLPLSRFLTSPFIFSGRTISLIDQSVKGYFQLAHFFKKNEEQVLDLLPLEKVDEYYFPGEIEEEIIVPSNFPGSLRRKITSSSHSPHLGERAEKMSSATAVGDAASKADSFGKALSRDDIGQQQSQIDSPQYVSENVSHRKKSLVNTPSKEENQSNLGSESNKQSPKFITEPEKYPSEKLPTAFTSKTKNLPSAEDEHNIKKSSLTSIKAHSGVIVSSEGTQLFPRKNSEPARLSSSSSSSSSISASAYDDSSLGLNESKPAASKSSKSHKSKVIAKDDNNNKNDQGSLSEQFTNIPNRILEPSSSSSIQPNAKSPIKSNINNDSPLARLETHGVEESNSPHHKPIHIEDIVQSKEVKTPADKSLNLPNISQSAQDSTIGLMRSKDITNNASFASMTASSSSTTKIDDTRNNIIKPYNLSRTSISDGKQKKPTITINKLEVHVVGSNNNNVQRPMLNRSMKIADSRSHKLDFEDLQVNTETLNKSYLWKYKVRL
jgi:hypothetical protein